MKKTKIKIVKAGTVAHDQTRNVGEVVAVEADAAKRLIDAGLAVPAQMVRVRALRTGLFGQECHAVGDVFELVEDVALAQYRYGKVEIVDHAALTRGLPAVIPLPEPEPKPPGPYDDEPMVSIRVKRHFLSDTTCLSPGPKPMSVPKCIAEHAVAAGAAEYVGIKGAIDSVVRPFKAELNRPAVAAAL